MDNPFEGETPPVVTPPKFEDLVGEGKKYKTQEDAAFALVEKDRFIEQIKRENAEMRAAIAKKDNEDEFLAKLQQVAAPKPPEPQDPPVQQRDVKAAPSVTPEDIEKLLDEREAKRQAAANLKTVTDRLQELYGDEYKSRVQSQAKALGVGTEFLSDIAAKNPTAFYKLLGLDNQRQQDDFSPPPRTQVNTITSPPSNRKDYNYYAKQRQEKGDSWYFSPQVQQEIWRAAKEAEKRGERFLPE